MTTTMKMTKVEMARRVIKQLYMMAELPAADHFKVKKYARQSKATLERQLELAEKAEAAQLAAANEERTGKWIVVREFATGQLTSEHDTEAEANEIRDAEIAEGKTFRGGRVPSEYRVYQARS